MVTLQTVAGLKQVYPSLHFSAQNKQFARNLQANPRVGTGGISTNHCPSLASTRTFGPTGSKGPLKLTPLPLHTKHLVVPWSAFMVHHLVHRDFDRGSTTYFNRKKVCAS